MVTKKVTAARNASKNRRYLLTVLWHEINRADELALQRQLQENAWTKLGLSLFNS